MSVLDASEVFRSELRLRLIRHFLDHPGTQADAARALGVATGTVTPNTRALVELGVVVETPSPDRRARIHSVDLDRYDELLSALHSYAHQQPATAASDESSQG